MDWSKLDWIVDSCVSYVALLCLASRRPCIIGPLSDPIKKTRLLQIMYGNLCPGAEVLPRLLKGGRDIYGMLDG